MRVFLYLIRIAGPQPGSGRGAGRRDSSDAHQHEVSPSVSPRVRLVAVAGPGSGRRGSQGMGRRVDWLVPGASCPAGELGRVHWRSASPELCAGVTSPWCWSCCTEPDLQRRVALIVKSIHVERGGRGPREWRASRQGRAGRRPRRGMSPFNCVVAGPRGARSFHRASRSRSRSKRSRRYSLKLDRAGGSLPAWGVSWAPARCPCRPLAPASADSPALEHMVLAGPRLGADTSTVGVWSGTSSRVQSTLHVGDRTNPRPYPTRLCLYWRSMSGICVNTHRRTK